jgi:hypothetical protein
MKPPRSRSILHPLSSIVVLLACASLLPVLHGCAALGVLAYKIAPAETIKPQYTNLQNQTVGVMVWADRGIRIDFPTLQLDLANAIQTKLQAVQADKDQKKNALALTGTTFPYPAASFVRYQKDHPEIEAMPIDQIAPRLGVSRLIYVEIQSFATRSDLSVDLYRGQAKAIVKVFEIQDGKATSAHEWGGVEASYPPKSPPEGQPGIGDARTYAGTVDAFGTEIAHLFVPYQVEE